MGQGPRQLVWCKKERLRLPGGEGWLGDLPDRKMISPGLQTSVSSIAASSQSVTLIVVPESSIHSNSDREAVDWALRGCLRLMVRIGWESLRWKRISNNPGTRAWNRARGVQLRDSKYHSGGLRTKDSESISSMNRDGLSGLDSWLRLGFGYKQLIPKLI